jgi:ankyrin repeat protein
LLIVTGKETFAKLSEAREANSICKHFSSYKCDLEQLKETLSDGDKNDINTHMSTGETPLLYAILEQDIEAIQLLLQYDADVNMAGAFYDAFVNSEETHTSHWMSPAQAAVLCEDVDIANTVLEKISEGFEVDAVKWRKLCEKAMRKPENMCMRLAVQLVTSFTPLRNNLRNSSKHDCFGRVLLVAAELGLCGIAEHLLLHNADPNYYYEHQTPLVAAAINGHIDMCRLLVQHGARVNSEASACDALVIAVGYGSVVAMETLLSLGCQYKLGVLLNPICSYLNEVLKKKESEDDKEYNNRSRNTKKKAKKVDYLIEDGTLLHLAVLTKSVPVVNCLLDQYGAQDLLTIINSSGNSALEVAAMQTDVAMIDALLTHMHAAGIDTTQYMSGRNNDNKSALLCGLQANHKHCKSCDKLWCYRDLELVKLFNVFLKWHVDFRLEPEESCIAALGVAIACNKIDLVPRMVECHFDVPKYINMRCFADGLTPLEV